MVKFFGRKQKADKVLVEVVPAGTRGRMEALEMDVSAARDSAQAWKSRALDGDAFAGRLEADLNVARAECEVLRVERDELREAIDTIAFTAMPYEVRGVEKSGTRGGDPKLIAKDAQRLFADWFEMTRERTDAERQAPDAFAGVIEAGRWRHFADVPEGETVTGVEGSTWRKRNGVGEFFYPTERQFGVPKMIRVEDYGPFEAAVSPVVAAEPAGVVEPRVWQTIEDVPEGIKVEDKTADGDRWWWEGQTLIYQCTESNGDVMDAETWGEGCDANRYAPFTEVAA